MKSESRIKRRTILVDGKNSKIKMVATRRTTSGNLQGWSVRVNDLP